MTRATTRHHRERVVANRTRFIRNVLGYEVTDIRKAPGTLAKRKALDCSCPMCQSPTRGTPKGKERQVVKYSVWEETT